MSVKGCVMGATDQKLCDFIVKQLLRGSTAPQFGPDARLFDDDILDSLSLLELIEFIEQEFAVEIGDQHLRAENFETVRSLAILVDSLRA